MFPDNSVRLFSTSTFASGVVSPIPNLLFTSSQYIPLNAVHTPALLYNICPSVPVGNNSSPEFKSVHDNVPLPLFVNIPIALLLGHEYVTFLILTISPLLSTWKRSPLPTVNREAGDVSPIPTLPFIILNWSLLFTKMYIFPVFATFLQETLLLFGILIAPLSAWVP